MASQRPLRRYRAPTAAANHTSIWKKITQKIAKLSLPDFSLASVFKTCPQTLRKMGKTAYRLVYRIGSKTARLLRKGKNKVLSMKGPIVTVFDHSCRWAKGIQQRHSYRMELLQKSPKEFCRRFFLRLMSGVPMQEAETCSRKEFRGRYLKPFCGRLACSFTWVIALSLTAFAVQMVRTHEMGLTVLINGERLCYVSSDEDTETAFLAIESKVSETLGKAYRLEYTPEYQLGIIPKDSISTNAELETELLAAVSDAVQYSNALFIDGELIGTNNDQTGIEQILSDLLAPYRSDDPDETVNFVQDVEIKSGLLPTESTATLFDLRDLLSQSSVQEQTYTVQEDDLVSTIAQKIGATTDQILTMNPDVVPERLNVGDQLIIEKAQPRLAVQSISQVEYKEAIAYETEKIQNDSLYTGTTQVKTKGEEGVRSVCAEVCKVNGEQVSSTVLSTTVLQQPVTQEVYVGTKERPRTLPTGSYIRPVSGGYISSRYGYRGGGELHTGIDVALAYGSTVKASDGGTVTFAGWSGNYGYIVKISHGNGVETWYAHNSSLLVSRGDKVYQGQAIARVGSTGRSSGAHCHFEFRINGAARNPAKYVSF